MNLAVADTEIFITIVEVLVPILFLCCFVIGFVLAVAIIIVRVIFVSKLVQYMTRVLFYFQRLAKPVSGLGHG